MADLKPLVPRWREDDDHKVSDLMVENVSVGFVQFAGGRWRGRMSFGVERNFATEAEARAWVEAQLYGEAPRG